MNQMNAAHTLSILMLRHVSQVIFYLHTFIAPMPSTCAVHLISIDLITLIFIEDYK
jgi:hypothetical protein